MILQALFLSCLLLVVYPQTLPEKAQITNLPNLTQDVYQGWILSDSQTETYLYYQLYSADGTSFNKSSKNPLLVYLEGGPGSSGILTAWSDIGPYGVNSNINITGPNVPADTKFSVYKRNNSWCGPYHLLIIDAPAFTGFSYSAKGFLSNQTDNVAQHLANFMDRFYQLYDQIKDNQIHIVGRSYGGHWAPALGYELVKNRKRTNVAGLILLCPLVSLKSQVGWADFFYSHGVTDTKRRDFIKTMDYTIKKFIDQNDTVKATVAFSQEQSAIKNLGGVKVTNNIAPENVRRNHYPGYIQSLELIKNIVPPYRFFNFTHPAVKTARDLLNIPSNVVFLEGYCTEPFMLAGDIANDYAYAVEYLLEKGVQTTVVGGQDDGQVFVPALVNMVSKLNWSGRQSHRASERKIWKYYNGSVVGNYKKYKNLNLATLYKAGHFMTMDQPDVMLQFMNHTVFNKWS